MGTDNGEKILVVDDDPAVLELVSSFLIMWGHDALACGSAEEAIAAFREGGVNLVVSDIRMPGISGTELLGMIHELNADIPVILMTAYADLETAIDALRKGAFDLIIKPFKIEFLQHSIEKGVRFRHLVAMEKNYKVMLEEKMRESEANMRSAAAIQQSLLPVSVPQVEAFDFSWQFLPCEQVGGDLYNLFRLDENRLGAYVLDVGGHGVPAAMVSATVSQTLDHFRGWFKKRAVEVEPFHEFVTPARIIAKLNSEYPLERFGKLLTICYLILDTNSGKVRYSNAALPLPVLIRADGRIETLHAGGSIIGVNENALYEDGEISMESGDRLFIYTDGITECLDKSGETYGEKRLISVLQQFSGETLQTVCTRVIESLALFSEKQQYEDDITLLGIEFRQPL